LPPGGPDAAVDGFDITARYNADPPPFTAGTGLLQAQADNAVIVAPMSMTVPPGTVPGVDDSGPVNEAYLTSPVVKLLAGQVYNLLGNIYVPDNAKLYLNHAAIDRSMIVLGAGAVIVDDGDTGDQTWPPPTSAAVLAATGNAAAYSLTGASPQSPPTQLSDPVRPFAAGWTPGSQVIMELWGWSTWEANSNTRFWLVYDPAGGTDFTGAVQWGATIDRTTFTGGQTVNFALRAVIMYAAGPAPGSARMYENTSQFSVGSSGQSATANIMQQASYDTIQAAAITPASSWAFGAAFGSSGSTGNVYAYTTRMTAFINPPAP
jgi:hypothetical protein